MYIQQILIFLLIFLPVPIAIFVGVIIYYKKSPIRNIHKLKKETRLFRKFYVRHMVGLNLSDSALCLLYFTNNNIVIEQVKDNRVLKTFSLNNEYVISLEEDTLIERQLQSGDPIGNALLGGLLFGGIGAIVGATSGNKIYDTKKDLDVLKIKYKSNNEEKYIIFLCEYYKKDYHDFINLYNKYILKVTNRQIENIKL